MQRALSRNLIGKRAQRELLSYLDNLLPPLRQPTSRSAWEKHTTRIRREILDLFFRGHPDGLLEEKPRVEWRGTLNPGNGYRIRKLRYEGYPGLWVPALLYEPTRLKDKVPAVLNPNGHHIGGKAMDYKQARCINLAKRGMLALNTEFIGMGELRADAEHNRIGHLDLCGVAGIGVFYLLMKRSLDLLLDHGHADAERVAMTGLSGGGWQTALLSALDERVTTVVPVAGHSPVWQRTRCMSDIGDVEQVPADLCGIADYDELTAMFAPRPTLLIYNRNDDCCFQTRRTRKSVYQPVKPVFALYGAADRLAFHDNTDPGTHNYESDNRSQFYQFLNKHWNLDTPAADLPWQGELYPEDQLNVGLPADNATLLSLAQQALQKIRSRKKKKATPAAARRQLSGLLKLPSFASVQTQRAGADQKRKDCTIRHHVLHLDDTWSVPITEFSPPRARGLALVAGDGGRRSSAGQVDAALAQGQRVLAVDLFDTGELQTSWQYHMIIATTGRRSLGLVVGQLLAVVEWACKKHRATALDLRASGQILPIVALIAAALKPTQLNSLTTGTLIDSLGRVIDWPMSYAQAAPLCCFGLLEAFDLGDLIELSAPVSLHDANRGPLRR